MVNYSFISVLSSFISSSECTTVASAYFSQNELSVDSSYTYPYLLSVKFWYKKKRSRFCRGASAKLLYLQKAEIV